MRDNSEFYINHQFLPTKTNLNFCDQSVLTEYNKKRIYLFQHCLRIPTSIFLNSTYLEIGPDSGENALSAASLGAFVWCVDANQKAIESTQELFFQSSFNQRLKNSQIVNFVDAEFEENFDFVVAEGLIHSVEKKEAFLDKVINIIKPNAFVILSYYDQVSVFGDLLHSRIFKTLVKNHLGISNLYGSDIESVIEFGEKIFQKKWFKKNHLRSLRTWILDILLNPVMDASRTLNPIETIIKFGKKDLNYWSSYTSYRNEREIRR